MSKIHRIAQGILCGLGLLMAMSACFAGKARASAPQPLKDMPMDELTLWALACTLVGFLAWVVLSRPRP